MSASEIFEVVLPPDAAAGAELRLHLEVSDDFPGRADTAIEATLSIRADTAGPSISIEEPLAGAIFQETADGKITVSARIVDAEVGVKEVTASIDQGQTLPMTLVSADLYQADLPIPNVIGSSNEALNIVVTAADYAGNSSTEAVGIEITPNVDPNGPVITWLCLSNGAMYPEGYELELRIRALGNPEGTASVASVMFSYTDPATGDEISISGDRVSATSNEYVGRTKMVIPTVNEEGPIQVRVLVKNNGTGENDEVRELSW